MMTRPERIQAVRERDAQTRAVNAALDSHRAALGFKNDLELAEHFDVAPKTLSFWRMGKWTKGDEALIQAFTTLISGG